jgi:hypothetical protein
LAEDDKGITKLEKFFIERGAIGYEPHVEFLRVLQDLRSKSAVHRKGSTYDELIVGLQMADEGQQKILRPNSLSPCDFASKAHGLNRARNGIPIVSQIRDESRQSNLVRHRSRWSSKSRWKNSSRLLFNG